jgi:hypothetical protein
MSILVRTVPRRRSVRGAGSKYGTRIISIVHVLSAIGMARTVCHLNRSVTVILWMFQISCFKKEDLMSYLVDIEDFSTDQLRVEINRRERATREGRCWYCQGNLEAHTCKYAKPSPVPGWEIYPAKFVEGEDCMANQEKYWRAYGWHPVMNNRVIGIGGTKEEATARCIDNAREQQKTWQIPSLIREE